MFYNSRSVAYNTSKVKKIEKLENECGNFLNPKMSGAEVLKTWNQLRSQYTTT